MYGRIERNDIMSITEILEEIHKQRVELEICQELQRWLLDDRAEWIDRAMDAESTVNHSFLDFNYSTIYFKFNRKCSRN